MDAVARTKPIPLHSNAADAAYFLDATGRAGNDPWPAAARATQLARIRHRLRELSLALCPHRKFSSLGNTPRYSARSENSLCEQMAARSYPRIGDGYELEEEGEFYVPDLLHDEEHEPKPGLHAAADAHTRRLHKAERHVDEALLLSQVLRASMADAGDRRAMQVETVLRIVEKKLRKARSQIDKHDARHVNLFMAYFDLKDRSDG